MRVGRHQERRWSQADGRTLGMVRGSVGVGRRYVSLRQIGFSGNSGIRDEPRPPFATIELLCVSEAASSSARSEASAKRRALRTVW
jgi:hypothetical protein